jgi:hypothetical protein
MPQGGTLPSVVTFHLPGDQPCVFLQHSPCSWARPAEYGRGVSHPPLSRRHRRVHRDGQHLCLRQRHAPGAGLAKGESPGGWVTLTVISSGVRQHRFVVSALQLGNLKHI